MTVASPNRRPSPPTFYTVIAHLLLRHRLPDTPSSRAQRGDPYHRSAPAPTSRLVIASEAQRSMPSPKHHQHIITHSHSIIVLTAPRTPHPAPRTPHLAPRHRERSAAIHTIEAPRHPPRASSSRAKRGDLSPSKTTI